MGRSYTEELERIDDVYQESRERVGKKTMRFIWGAVGGLGLMLYFGSNKINPERNPYWNSEGRNELRRTKESLHQLKDLEQNLSSPLLMDSKLMQYVTSDSVEFERIRSKITQDIEKIVRHYAKKAEDASNHKDVRLYNIYNQNPWRIGAEYASGLLAIGLAIGGMLVQSLGNKRCTKEYLASRYELETEFEALEKPSQ